jgi:SAM-dependent methyltransferase
VTVPTSGSQAGVLTSYPPEVRRGSPFAEHSPPARALRKALSRFLRPAMRVLDIGCGNAVGACHLAAAGADAVDYVGLEPDPEQWRVARAVLAGLPPARVSGQVLERTIARHVAAGAPAVDVVLWNFALHECLEDGDAASGAALAAGVADLMVPGGLLLVGEVYVAEGASPGERDRIVEYNRRIAGRGDGGKALLDPRVIADLFARAGLVRIEQLDCALTTLAPRLGMPSARYGLAIFGKAAR